MKYKLNSGQIISGLVIFVDCISVCGRGPFGFDLARGWVRSYRKAYSMAFHEGYLIRIAVRIGLGFSRSYWDWCDKPTDITKWKKEHTID